MDLEGAFDGMHWNVPLCDWSTLLMTRELYDTPVRQWRWKSTRTLPSSRTTSRLLEASSDEATWREWRLGAGLLPASTI